MAFQLAQLPSGQLLISRLQPSVFINSDNGTPPHSPNFQSTSNCRISISAVDPPGSVAITSANDVSMDNNATSSTLKVDAIIGLVRSTMLAPYLLAVTKASEAASWPIDSCLPSESSQQRHSIFRIQRIIAIPLRPGGLAALIDLTASSTAAMQNKESTASTQTINAVASTISGSSETASEEETTKTMKPTFSMQALNRQLSRLRPKMKRIMRSDSDMITASERLMNSSSLLGNSSLEPLSIHPASNGLSVSDDSKQPEKTFPSSPTAEFREQPSKSPVAATAPINRLKMSLMNRSTELRDYLNWPPEKRLINEISAIFSSGTFYFCHSIDITTSTQHKFSSSASNTNNNNNQSSSKHSSIDDRFWWSKHLSQPFHKTGFGDWTVPIMQGFVQCESDTIEGHPFEFLLISRRSCRRAGLRYQRRGIDSDGHVANFVETEQVFWFPSAPADTIASDISNQQRRPGQLISFVQLRGSIPLFWSQNAQSRKPVPQLEKDEGENLSAMRRHFASLLARYGKPLVLISLVETAGRESKLGEAFGQTVSKLSDDLPVDYFPFDMHLECRGMRYEKLSGLMDRLTEKLDSIGYFWCAGNETFHRQSGVIRTNCMDCLDRTNVAQCLIARHVLNQQLLRLGIHQSPEDGLGYYPEIETKFNNVWANNGDAISIAYTNTTALKGDVTRTGRRNVKGVVNDGTAMLLRMYQNNFRDAYRQSVINMLLGLKSFEDVANIQKMSNEGALSGSNPEMSRETVLKIQQEAVDTCKALLLDPGESFIANHVVIHIQPICTGKNYSACEVEKILLLTNSAYYICLYDYAIEKVTQFKRVQLNNIALIQKGPYTVDDTSQDDPRSYALALFYHAENEENRISGTVRPKRKSQQKQLASDEEFLCANYTGVGLMKIDLFKTTQTAANTEFDSQQSMEKILNDFVVQTLDITTVPIEQFVEDTTICFKTLARASSALSPGLTRKFTRIFRKVK